jgi:hypothetical protein
LAAVLNGPYAGFLRDAVTGVTDGRCSRSGTGAPSGALWAAAAEPEPDGNAGEAELVAEDVLKVSLV